jgi:hypothetical protein
MLRRILISTYLLLYTLSIMWALAVVLMRADRSGYFNKSVLVLGVLTGALLLLSNLGSLFGKRWFPSAVWVVMIAWSAFLSWFGWFSDGSPFIQHEVHSFDPNQLAAESHHFRTVAVFNFSLLLFWFWSYIFLWWHRRLDHASNTIRDPRV